MADLFASHGPVTDADLGIGVGLALGVFVLVGVLGTFVYEPLEEKIGGWWQRRRKAKRAAVSGSNEADS